MLKIETAHAKPQSREGSSGEHQPELEEIARVVVDAAYHLHRDLGPGLLESAYELLLSHALTKAGLHVERQKGVTIEYDGITLTDAFRIDLLVESRLVIELKSVEALAKVHSKQLLTYLRLTKQPLGLLINFGAASFSDGIKRVVNGHTDFAASRLRVNQTSSDTGAGR